MVRGRLDEIHKTSRGGLPPGIEIIGYAAGVGQGHLGQSFPVFSKKKVSMGTFGEINTKKFISTKDLSLTAKRSHGSKMYEFIPYK